MPICFNQYIDHGGDRLHMSPPPPRLRPPQPHVLSLKTFKLRNKWDIGLAQAIQVVQISIFDLMILTDTKITYQSYCLNRLVYNVVCLSEITVEAGCTQRR